MMFGDKTESRGKKARYSKKVLCEDFYNMWLYSHAIIHNLGGINRQKLDLVSHPTYEH